MTQLIEALQVGFKVARLNVAGEAIYAAVVTEINREAGTFRAAVVERDEYGRKYGPNGKSPGDTGLAGIVALSDERWAEIKYHAVRRELDRKLNDLVEDYADMPAEEQSRLLTLIRQFRFTEIPK